MRSINRSFLLTFIVGGDVYPVAGSNRTKLTISLAHFDRLARSPAGLWVLSMANCGEGGEEGDEGEEKGEREKEGGTFRVLGEFLFRT